MRWITRYLAFAWSLASLTAVADAIDFESMHPGEAPSGWLFPTTGDGAPSRWIIILDPTSPAREKVLAQLSTERSFRRIPLAIYLGVELADGTLSVQFKAVSGGVDQEGGLVWRYRDERNYYVVGASALEHNVQLLKVEGGRRHLLGSNGRLTRDDESGVDLPIFRGRWSKLQVSFAGSMFVVFLDGAKLFAVEDATFPQAGWVGLSTRGDSVTYFDDFEMTSKTKE